MKTSDLYELFIKYPNICTDTRKLEKNSIFFALKGDNFDANTFAADALKTCKYAVVDNPNVVKNDAYILVDDVLDKLQKLAAYHRKRLGLPILALTGSNGKTTTKELIVSVMQKKFNVGYTKGNFNNHIGVPLTLLSFTGEMDFGVVEMGANHVGEIALLSKIVAPDFGLITNVGKAHLEGFGSFEGVKKGKGELYEYLYYNDGTAFINYDNEILEEMNPPHSAIYYGTKGFTHCQGRLESEGVFLAFRWLTSDESFEKEVDWEIENRYIQTKLIGDYNFENALAAVCIGNNFHVSETDIKQAIESYQPNNSRSQYKETENNKVIVDSYNANPTSMKISLENFSKMPDTDKVVILGDMFELGSASIREHGVVVGLLEELHFNNAILIGEDFMNYSEIERYKFFKNTEDYYSYLKKNPIKNKLVFVKGSRGMKLEMVIELL